MTLIREMQDAKIGERKKKKKMWSKVITVKKGELLIPDRIGASRFRHIVWKR